MKCDNDRESKQVQEVPAYYFEGDLATITSAIVLYTIAGPPLSVVQYSNLPVGTHIFFRIIP